MSKVDGEPQIVGRQAMTRTRPYDEESGKQEIEEWSDGTFTASDTTWQDGQVWPGISKELAADPEYAEQQDSMRQTYEHLKARRH